MNGLEDATESVHIPRSLYRKLERAIEDTDFSSVSSYVTHILRGHMARREGGERLLTDEEEAEIKERLKALGYLD